MAHVVNGISLYQGLFNGTSSADRIISELLNISPFIPSDIQGIDTDKLGKSIEEIKGLSAKLKTDDGIKKLESRYLILGSILNKMKGVDKKFQIPKEKEYLAALGSFSKDSGDLAEVDSNISAFDPAEDEALRIGENMKVVSSLENLKPASPYFKVIEKLYISRKNLQGDRLLLDTSGFPDGFSDLEKISTDLDDKWIQSVVKKQSNKLKKELEPLLNLFNKFKEVADTLELNEVDRESLIAPLTELIDLSSILPSFDTLSADIKNIKISEKMDDMEPTNTQAFEEVFNKIILFSDQLKAIETLIHLPAQISGHLQTIGGIFKITDTKKAPSQRDQLLASEEFKNVMKILQNYEQELKLFGIQGSSVSQISEVIPTEFSEIRTYIDGLDKFFDNFAPLRAIKGIEDLESVIRSIQKYRDGSSSLNIDKAISIIPKTKLKIDDLTKSDSKMKNAKGALLMKLKNIGEESHQFGSAIREISSMQKLTKFDSKKLNELEKLVKEKMINSTLSTSDMNQLNMLDGLSGKLENLTEKVSDFKKSIKIPESSDLKSLSPILTSSQNIKGLQLSFDPLLESIRNLISDPVSLKSATSTLINLFSIGLKFDQTSHKTPHLDILTSLDNTFVKYSTLSNTTTGKQGLSGTIPPTAIQIHGICK
uniref:WSN domain-containing protein n=1 Tax=Caenorhabditis tropicalis TaxID=1561998 RepID=A0A1I7U975_9PELO